jgi:hypothetical protein
MTTTRLLGALGFTMGLTLAASSAFAKSSYWYTVRSCQFYPGGGHRTPVETAACRQRAIVGETMKYCRDQQRRNGRILCGPPLFWLTYRHPDGRAAGVVVIQSADLLHACLKASLAGADRQLEFASGHQLSTRSVPS